MSAEDPKLLSHIPNSGIVQLPGRHFPGIVMQGDTLFMVLNHARFLLGELKRQREEERYFEVLNFAEQLQDQLLHYERTLHNLGMPLPYGESVQDRLVSNDFDT